jgi:hypothetical protein
LSLACHKSGASGSPCGRRGETIRAFQRNFTVIVGHRKRLGLSGYQGVFTTRCEFADIAGDCLRRFHLVRAVRDSLQDRIIQPMSDRGSSGRRFKSCQADLGQTRFLDAMRSVSRQPRKRLRANRVKGQKRRRTGPDSSQARPMRQHRGQAAVKKPAFLGAVCGNCRGHGGPSRIGIRT